MFIDLCSINAFREKIRMICCNAKHFSLFHVALFGFFKTNQQSDFDFVLYRKWLKKVTVEPTFSFKIPQTGLQRFTRLQAKKRFLSFLLCAFFGTCKASITIIL